MNTTCRICNTSVTSEDSFCLVCQYPLKGTEKEQASFGAKFIIQKGDIQDSIERTKKARFLLFFLGAIYLILPFTPLFNITSNVILFINVFVGVFFIGCGALSFKNAKIAFLIPLIVVTLYYLLPLFNNPFSLFRGLLWKMIILVILGYGYFSVRKADKIMKKNKYIVDILEEEALNAESGKV